MIVSKNVELAGIKLKKWYSNNLKKIKCNEYNNIYSAAYTSRDANLSFEETNLPLNEITSGAIISVDDVWGLSDKYVQKYELVEISNDISVIASSLESFIGEVSSISSSLDSISVEIDNINKSKSSISVDNEKDDLNLVHITLSDYAILLSTDSFQKNWLYVLSTNEGDMFGERITNISPATDSNDAVSYGQLSTMIGDVETKIISCVPSTRKINGQVLTSDISVGTVTGIKMNGVSKGFGGNIDLGTVLTSHQSLAAYASKQSLSELCSEISTKSSVFVDKKYSPSLSIANVSGEEYCKILSNGPIPTNSLYVLSSNVNDQMGERVANLAEASELSDAMPMWQIRRDFVSKQSIVAVLSGLDILATTRQLINALLSLSDSSTPQ